MNCWRFCVQLDHDDTTSTTAGERKASGFRLQAPASSFLPTGGSFCNFVHYLCIAEGAALFTTIFLEKLSWEFLAENLANGRESREWGIDREGQ
jgi:hypothetical protein